jgi:RNA polymerase-binding transcription factor DksA
LEVRSEWKCEVNGRRRWSQEHPLCVAVSGRLKLRNRFAPSDAPRSLDDRSLGRITSETRLRPGRMPQQNSLPPVPQFPMAIKRRKPVSRRPRAATADVLGTVSRPATVPVKWRKHYKRLVEARDFLHGRKGELAKEAKEEQPVYSLHMADAGTDSFDRDFALSRISSEQDAAYEIEEAINRIYNRTYGICELTGKPIEPERLIAIPWTRFSHDAEEQLEKDGTIRLARLAPSEAVARDSGGETGSTNSRSNSLPGEE